MSAAALERLWRRYTVLVWPGSMLPTPTLARERELAALRGSVAASQQITRRADQAEQPVTVLAAGGRP